MPRLRKVFKDIFLAPVNISRRDIKKIKKTITPSAVEQKPAFPQFSLGGLPRVVKGHKMPHFSSQSKKLNSDAGFEGLSGSYEEDWFLRNNVM
jgi:hypothetical protein